MSLDQHLDRAVADLHERLATIQIPAPPRPTVKPSRAPRWSRRDTVVIATFAAVVVIGGLAGAIINWTERDTLPLANPAPLFGEETGVTLLFDDGLDGLIAVDLDRSIATHVEVEGQRPGDPPRRLLRLGDRLLVGWSEIHALDIEERRSTPLAEATLFAPAAETDRVWMVDYQNDRLGTYKPSVWQVDAASGEPLGDPIPSPRHNVLIGVTDGLLITGDDVVELWRPTTGETTRLAAGYGIAIDAHGATLAWCVNPCEKLLLTDTETMETTTFSPPPGYVLFGLGWGGSFSPDGRHLAVLVGNREAIHVDGELSHYVVTERALWLLDRQTGEITVAPLPGAMADYVVWAPDGDDVFATSYSYGETETTIWRYTVSGDRLASVRVPVGGALQPVAVESELTTGYFGEPVELDACRRTPTANRPTLRDCTFRFTPVVPDDVPPEAGSHRLGALVLPGPGEVFVWGGGESESSRDGVRLTPDGALVAVPDAPVTWESHSFGVWTGSEYVVAGGTVPASEPSRNGYAAFDPERGTWRVVPEPPPVPPSGLGSPSGRGDMTVSPDGGIFMWLSASTAGVPSRGAMYGFDDDEWGFLPQPPMSVTDAALLADADGLWMIGGPLMHDGITNPRSYHVRVSRFEDGVWSQPVEVTPDVTDTARTALWGDGVAVLTSDGHLFASDGVDSRLLAKIPGGSCWWDVHLEARADQLVIHLCGQVRVMDADGTVHGPLDTGGSPLPPVIIGDRLFEVHADDGDPRLREIPLS